MENTERAIELILLSAFKSFRKEVFYFLNNHSKWRRATKDLLLLYISQNQAMILPRRFFKLEEEINLFKGIVKRNMPSDKVKFK
ncbi:YcxB family protein [Bacillus carboniphilus]|uniref:YcxB family protein n=1 Tax=Bacillus carboniphilus TaxID=86663 RepID=UPI003532608A